MAGKIFPSLRLGFKKRPLPVAVLPFPSSFLFSVWKTNSACTLSKDQKQTANLGRVTKETAVWGACRDFKTGKGQGKSASVIAAEMRVQKG